MRRLALLCVFLLPVFAAAQDAPPPTDPPKEPAKEAPKEPPKPPAWKPEALLATLQARNIGPTSMGGRVTDLAVYEKEPRIFYVASASGGVWRTDNGGMTFNVVFSREGSSNIGAVAVSQKDPNLIWVATGEGTSRNSVGWGDGIYKSTDAGKTWAKMGLEGCTHFSKVIIDPRNNDVVYAAGLGYLWGHNAERGVFKTTNGGQSWVKVLNLNEKAGAADMVMNPADPDTLLVAMWEKLRKPYTWLSGGPTSGLYKTTNGGKNWKRLVNGLPQAGFLGRIGLTYFHANPKVVVASVEHAEYQADNTRKSESGVYRSTDGGESWTKVNSLNPRPFYFSMPRQDPTDVNRIYLPAVSLHYSEDQGKTFKAMRTSVHVDHHAMWINPKDNNHIILGEDGGVAQSRDRGATWEHLNHMPIGQFYGIAFDMRKPYWVYGGLQDNGTWAAPTQTSRGGVAHFDAYTFFGGDGFHVQVDPEDWTTVYAESQGGNIGRVDLKYGGSKFIKPSRTNTSPPPAEGERWRFNWSSPIHLSPHNSRTIYFGGNKLFKSTNRGDSWRVISPDLSTNDPTKQKAGEGSATPEATGAEMHCTIITIGESPKKQGLLWVGTDDGRVHVSPDDGNTWSDVTLNFPDLPNNTWCTRVTPSRFEEGRCYVTFDGHRNNDYKTYVYVTEDMGKTFKKLNGNLPANEPSYVIKEGLKNPNLLYLGTEFSLWVSFDRGETWNRYRTGNFPTVPVHDLAIHPREGDLVIGTHGRGIYILPVAALEELTKENIEKDVVLIKPTNVQVFGRVTGGNWDGDRIYISPNTQPGANIAYLLKEDAKADPKVTIADAAGNTVAELTGAKTAGLNVVNWNARARGRIARAGDYRVTLKVGDKEYVTMVTVEDVTASGEASPPRVEMPFITPATTETEEEDEGAGDRKAA